MAGILQAGSATENAFHGEHDQGGIPILRERIVISQGTIILCWNWDLTQ